MIEADLQRLAELEQREREYQKRHGPVRCSVCDELLGHIQFHDANPATGPVYVRIARAKGRYPIPNGDTTRVITPNALWRLARDEFTWKDPPTPDVPAYLMVIPGEIKCPMCATPHLVKHPPPFPDRSELRRLRRRQQRAQKACNGAIEAPK